MKNFLFAFIAALTTFASLQIQAAPQSQQAPTGVLALEVTPATASVSIDRKERGQAPITTSLKPGAHLLEITADGYRTERRTIRIIEGETYSTSIDMQKINGLVLLKSEPQGAEVTIDGVTYGKTPCLISDLPIGTYQADLYLAGHRGTKVRFEIKDRIPVEASANLISDTATINVSANIDEAVEIKVNGIIRGNAPCTVDRIPAGEVTIEASAKGYKPFVQKTQLSESEVLDVSIKLEIQPAKLKIVSIPEGARVYFDNTFQGETPYVIENTTPGEHRVRVEKTGYDTLARTLSLARGADVTEEFRLKSNTGKITITSQPEGVIVYIDGVKEGVTQQSDTKGLSLPLEIDGIAEGKHELKFVKEGYKPKSGPCEIKRGDALIRRVDLERLFIPNYEVVTATGSRKGVLDSISGGRIRLETSPGVFKTFDLPTVIKHGKLQ